MSTPSQGRMAAAEALAPVVEGSRLFGKFQLLANLGSGGMGEVFLALSRSSLGVRKLIVIKRLKHFAEDDARSEAQQMFLNEARLATLLNHPNIVQTNDVGVEDGNLYLTMEYLDGQPLNAIVRNVKSTRRTLEDGILAKIISDALCGLHYAHDLCDYDGKPLSIVHRDLSPHNIFVTYEGVVKIVDFGIAKTAGGAKTEQGVIKGKFAYMAPEQATDDKVDRRADVFVMGIVLWELLTGKRLVFRKNDVQTIHRLLNETLEPVSSVRKDIDPKLDAIVSKALAHRPEDRYQTALEMREALEAYLTASFRPVRQEEIGALITDLFRGERTSMQHRIQQCIATAQEDACPDNLPALISSPEITPGPSGRGLLGTTLSGTLPSVTHTPAAVSVPVAQPAPASSKRSGAVITALAVVAIGLLVLVFTRGSGGSRAAADAPNANAPNANAPIANAPIANTPSPAAPAAPIASAAPAEPSHEPTLAAADPAAASAPTPSSPPSKADARKAARASSPAPAPPRAAPTGRTPPSNANATPAATSTAHARVFNTEL